MNFKPTFSYLQESWNIHCQLIQIEWREMCGALWIEKLACMSCVCVWNCWERFRVCGNVNWSRRRSTVNYGHRIESPILSEIVSHPPPSFSSSCPASFSESRDPQAVPSQPRHTGALVRGAQQPTPGFLNVKLPFFPFKKKSKNKKRFS